MRDDNRRTDLIEEIGACLAPHQVLRVERTGRLRIGRRRRGAATGSASWRTTGSPTWRATLSAWAAWLLHDVAATLPRNELIEIGRPDVAGARPLRGVLLILIRRCGGVCARRRKTPCDVLEHGRRRRKSTMQIRVDWRSPVPRTIDDVDFEAL